MTLVESIGMEDILRWFRGARVQNIRRYAPYVLAALNDSDYKNNALFIACAFGTIAAETAGFVPLSEGKSYLNAGDGSHPFAKYDGINGNLPAVQLKDEMLMRARHGDEPIHYHGERYKGRGFVQLTGRENYYRFGMMIGLGQELLQNPDLANEPETAAELLVAYLTDHWRRIDQALRHNHIAKARAAVNGGTHGILRFWGIFEKVLLRLDRPLHDQLFKTYKGDFNKPPEELMLA